MALYVVKYTERSVGGFGRFKDEVRVLKAPEVVNTKTGNAICLRPNEGKMAEALAQALNDRKVYFDSRTDDNSKPFVSGKYLKQTLNEAGVYC